MKQFSVVFTGSGDVTTIVDLREIVLSDVTLTIEVSDSTGKTSQFILFLTICKYENFHILVLVFTILTCKTVYEILVMLKEEVRRRVVRSCVVPQLSASLNGPGFYFL